MALLVVARVAVVISLLLLGLIVAVNGKRSSAPFQFEEEDAALTVPQLIRKYGYNVEEHRVLTEDGYILTMYRIPPRNGSSTKRPILMMHSLISSCSDFVLIGPKHALAYLFADRDYDIWLGNARGNRYSRKHKRFHVKSPKFWNFTFHEIGYYDVPASIDYVLDKTNSVRLHYIGFSQGTLVSFVAMSTRPEYNAKVIQMQEISPAAYLGEPLSLLIRILSFMAPSIADGFNAVGANEFLPHWKGQYDFYNTVCPAPAQTLCRMLLNDVVGANPRQLDPPQLIRKYGYNVEEHRVLTEDGYILTMYRIPPRNASSTKRPILMMHSLISSCSDFVLIGPKHALAYLFADRNYDIWLGNARGNRYSRKHKRFHVKSPKFWNFTFHEIGYYDVPASIDYVLDKTNSVRLHYVGFSQGTLVSFVAMSTRPEYNAKVIQMQEISPAAYLGEPLSLLIRILSFMAPSIADGFNAVGANEFLPHWKGQYDFYNTVCPAPAQTLCRMLLNDVVGANPRQLDPKTLRIFLGHFPAGAGVLQILHYTQVFKDGIFRRYDYGDDAQNRAAYGSTQVPRYNISRITAPVRIYYGYNDNVIPYANVQRLERDLPNVVGSYLVPDERFTHADFILANQVKELLYDEIVKNVEAAERDG